MKRPLLFAILVVIAALTFAYAAFTAPALAAPVAQETRPVIAQPGPDAPVRDVVQIIGTATHPQFQRYELYYAPSPVPSDQSWTFIGDAHNNQQPLGLLGTWDSRSVPDGAYVLRVRVVKQDGNYIDSDARRVIVANTRAPETPTPDPGSTPPPDLPPTDAPVADQPVVEQPTVVVQIPTIAPTPTLEPNDAAAIANGRGHTRGHRHPAGDQRKRHDHDFRRGNRHCIVDREPAVQWQQPDEHGEEGRHLYRGNLSRDRRVLRDQGAARVAVV